jgi:hypothetical protein
VSILVNRPDNRRRPPDWRWMRACALAEGTERPVRGRDDEVVKAACKFRRLLLRCQTDADKLAALDAAPQLYDAYEIYSSSDSPEQVRWELEARILAREPRADIERKLGVDAATLDIYQEVFFDVDDRLDAPSLITHVVIGRALHAGGLAEREHDCLWKLFGYWCGPIALDAFVYKFGKPRRVESAEGLRDALRDFTKDVVEMKGTVTLVGMPIGWQTREVIVNLWKDLMAMEVQLGHSAAGQAAVLHNVDAMTATFKDLLMKQEPIDEERAPGTAGALEHNGTQLRAAELVAVGVGAIPEGLAQLMNSAQFPDKGDQNG